MNIFQSWNPYILISNYILTALLVDTTAGRFVSQLCVCDRRLVVFIIMDMKGRYLFEFTLSFANHTSNTVTVSVEAYILTCTKPTLLLNLSATTKLFVDITLKYLSSIEIRNL
jgi:hypothetical protein